MGEQKKFQVYTSVLPVPRPGLGQTPRKRTKQPANMRQEMQKKGLSLTSRIGKNIGFLPVQSCYHNQASPERHHLDE